MWPGGSIWSFSLDSTYSAIRHHAVEGLDLVFLGPEKLAIVAAIRMLNFWSCNFFGLRRLPNTLSSCPFTSIWWSTRFGDQQSAPGKTWKNLNLQWRKNLWTSDFRISAMGRCAAIALLVLLLGVEGGCQATGRSFWGNPSNEESKSANVANRRY